MNIVLSVVYVLVGVLVAIPYCFLAGWSRESYPTVAFVAPAFLFIWFLLAVFLGVVEIRDKGRVGLNWRAAFGDTSRRALPGSMVVFWGWTVYSLLPIILHWSSVLLEKAGHETASTHIYMHRYASLLYVLSAAFVLVILAGMANNAIDRVKSVWVRVTHR